MKEMKKKIKTTKSSEPVLYSECGINYDYIKY